MHFSLDEFDCNDGTPVPADLIPNVRRTAEMLEILRDRCGDRPMIVMSGYRTVTHNKKVGGAPASFHLSGKAADVRVRGLTPNGVQGIVLMLQAEGAIGGVGRYDSFTHVDWGPKRTWDKRSPEIV